MRVVSWIACSIVLALWSARANADSPDAPIEYEAPDVCPSGAAFFSALRDHTSESWSRATTSTRSFAVKIAQNENGKFVGRFTSLEHGVPVAERRISARSCTDLVNAMAIVAALAVDAEVRIVTAARRHRAIVLPSPRVVHTPSLALESPPMNVRIAFGGGITSELGPAAPTVESSVELAWMTGIRPSVALASSFAVATASTNPGSVTLARAAMTTVVCPFHTLVGAAFDIAPCGSLAIGFTRPQVHELASPDESAEPLITPGVDLRALVWLDAVGFRFTAGLAVPIVQATFTTNVRPLFTTPPVALNASISLVIRVR
jgi:hypothetical protein